MNLFRIHIKPQGGPAERERTFEYCKDEKVLGVGWRTDSNRNTKNWDDYYKEASQKYKDLTVCKYIHKWVTPGDLVWTRDPSGMYYLARVLSGWEYWTTEESIAQDIDIANIFRCELKQVDIGEVPGKVVACFRSSRSIQGITDDRALEYSRYLWNVKSGQNIYTIDKAKYPDIFMMLDDEETEDLVFLYLQSKGWYVMPNSRKVYSTPFEYLCVNPKAQQVAGTQVKTGDSSLDKDKYVRFSHKIFLFQSNDLYRGSGSDDVETISREELVKFLKELVEWLPQNSILSRKFDLVNQLHQSVAPLRSA